VNRIVSALALALVAALAVSATASATSGSLRKQRFAVTFKGEHGQDWQVRPSDDESTPNCIVGEDAMGSSQLDAKTRKTRVVKLYANRKAGTAFGDVPVDAFLERTFTLGSKPPDDCLTKEYKQLATSATCDQDGIWSFYGHSPRAYVSIAAGRGAIGVKLIREQQDRIEREIFPLCPFAGVNEGKVEGQAKLSKARLFDGKPHTVKGYGRNDFPAPAEHSVEGYYEWKLTIQAINPKPAKRR
jgi:hypothetical protein